MQLSRINAAVQMGHALLPARGATVETSGKGTFLPTLHCGNCIVAALVLESRVELTPQLPHTVPKSSEDWQTWGWSHPKMSHSIGRKDWKSDSGEVMLDFCRSGFSQAKSRIFFSPIRNHYVWHNLIPMCLTNKTAGCSTSFVVPKFWAYPQTSTLNLWLQ